MNTSSLYSTFFLTLLLLIGLFFFIRASVKDRTEQITIVAQMSPEVLLSQLQTYLENRSYKITSTDPTQKQVIFEGFVGPSWFLAIFLSFLAAIGLFSLSLVLSLLYPSLSWGFFGLTLLAPVAGIFYWKNAARVEKVRLKVESVDEQGKTSITITAHRDELIQLQQATNHWTDTLKIVH